MKIEWQLDTEEGIDPIDPLGTIKIIDNNNNSIISECVYLDSLFYAIAQGLLEIEKLERYSSEVIDEPEYINFTKTGNSIEIEFQNQTIRILNLAEERNSFSESFLRFKEKVYGNNLNNHKKSYEETENLIKQFK